LLQSSLGLGRQNVWWQGSYFGPARADPQGSADRLPGLLSCPLARPRQAPEQRDNVPFLRNSSESGESTGKHAEAYKVLEGAFDSGKIRSIGVSNYTVEDYKELEAAGIRVQPVVNQVRRRPRAPSLPHSGHTREEELPDSEPPLREEKSSGSSDRCARPCSTQAFAPVSSSHSFENKIDVAVWWFCADRSESIPVPPRDPRLLRKQGRGDPKLSGTSAGRQSPGENPA